MTKAEINHFGDCSIYILGCDICDCGEFRKIMPDIDIIEDSEVVEKLLKHQCQVSDFAEIEINKTVKEIIVNNESYRVY